MSEGRLIAFFDILGFKNLVKSRNPFRVAETLSTFIRTATETKKWNSDFGLISFSDTIVLYTKPFGRQRGLCEDLIALSRELMIQMLRQEIFIRGVLHYGEFFCDHVLGTDFEMYYGKALVEAHEAESTENIVGLFMLPEAALCLFDKSPSVQLLCDDCYKKEYWVQYTERVFINLFQSILNVWEGEPLHDAIESSDSGILLEIQAYFKLREELEKKIKEGASSKIIAKYRNALRIFDHFLDGWNTSEYSRLEEMKRIYKNISNYSDLLDVMGYPLPEVEEIK